jgi:predicted ATPase/class 3 adenylate cyclase
MSESPTGTVTFLFTDIEGSSRLWEHYPHAMPAALAAHDTTLRGAIAEQHGEVVKSTGDGVLAAFASAADGVAAALNAQRALRAQEPSLENAPRIRVRMGLHSGEAQARDGDYFGGTLNRAARLMAIGHGGQVLLSEATGVLVRERLPAGAALLALGEQRLKDLTLPERVYQLNAPDLPADFPPLNSLSAYRHNLPVQLTSFVGRDAELAEVERLLHETRLLTLIGPGGTGKTRLSLQAAADLLDHFPDGVWLVELAPVTDPTQVEQAVASAFGVHEQPGVSMSQALADYVRSKQLLLVLDNCEHLIGAVAQVAQQLLQAGPRIKLMASSREGLALAGETIYQVPSLGLPPLGNTSDAAAVTSGGEPDALMQYESVRLFVERARAIAPSFALTADNAPAVAEICRRLDGIPLALELAAARIRLLTPAQISARLRDHFRLLVGGSRTALPRQQTLQALIDWSWNLLGEPERALLRRLSVFAGWSLEAAEEVCSSQSSVASSQIAPVGGNTNLTTDDWLLPTDDVLDTLGQLVNKSLVVVQQQADESRYRLLETIRQYAHEKLAAAGESTAFHERHARYYARLAAEYEPHYYGPELALWLRKFEMDAGNFGAADEWLLESDPLNALRLAIATSFVLQRGGRYIQCERQLSDAIERVRALAAPDGLALRTALAEGLTALGSSLIARGENRRAREAAREAAELAQAIEDRTILAHALGAQAICDMLDADYEHAEAEAHEALAIVRDTGQSLSFRRLWGITAVMSALASVHMMRGDDPAAAVAQSREAMRVAEAGGNPWALGMTAMNAARVAGFAGDFKQARALIERAKAELERAGDVHFAHLMIAELGHYLRRDGLRAEARAMYRQSLRWVQEFGNRGAVAHQLECFAMLALDDGAPGQAARLFGAAQQLREQASAPPTAFERTEYDAAQARLRAALKAEALERARAEGQALTMEQAVALALEQPDG